MRFSGVMMAVVGGLCAWQGQAWGMIGLSTQFVDAEFEGLQPGRTYNIREVSGVPYTVKNRGDGDVEVIVDGSVPSTKDVQVPYEPIPDASWITMNPSKFSIGANSLGFCDIIITVPDDPKLQGRHFQASLWARTISTGMLAAGVRTRLRFSIGPGPATLEKEAQHKAMVTLNYDLWPTGLYVQHAKAGEKYNAKEREKKPLILSNRNEDELELVFEAVPWPKGSIALPQGYEYVQDLSWVSFDPPTAKVEGFRGKDIGMVLNAPESLKGKKVAFLIQLKLPIGTVVSSTHRAFVTIE